MISWVLNKLLSVKIRLRTALNTRIDARGDDVGRIETRPYGSTPLPFAQRNSDGVLKILLVKTWLRLGRRFYMVDNLGGQTLLDPDTLTWTVHRQSDDALIETLTVTSIGVGDKVADLLVSLYTEDVYYYQRWTFTMPGGTEQIQTQRFMLVS